MDKPETINQKFFPIIFCLIVPPSPQPLTHKPRSPLPRGGNIKAKSKHFVTVPCQVTATWLSLYSGWRKVRIMHLANICMVSRAVRFIHLLTEVHEYSGENKSIQFNKHLSSSSLITVFCKGKKNQKPKKHTWLLELIFEEV